MKIWQTLQQKDEKANGGFISIHDKGFLAERKLVIEDDEGNTVCLKNEQIEELYNRIKPGLA